MLSKLPETAASQDLHASVTVYTALPNEINCFHPQIGKVVHVIMPIDFSSTTLILGCARDIIAAGLLCKIAELVFTAITKAGSTQSVRSRATVVGLLETARNISVSPAANAMAAKVCKLFFGGSAIAAVLGLEAYILKEQHSMKSFLAFFSKRNVSMQIYHKSSEQCSLASVPFVQVVKTGFWCPPRYLCVCYLFALKRGAAGGLVGQLNPDCNTNDLGCWMRVDLWVQGK